MVDLNIDIPHNWYVLYTKPRSEKKIYNELKNKGIEAYLPMRKTLHRWSVRKKWIETPVISSYIFVHITKEDYLRVFEVKGVVSYVSVNRKAVVIPEREIIEMQKAIDSNLSLNVEPGNIAKGQTITITSGPLKGIKGKVMDIQGTKKFYLRISHIGYMLVIDLNEDEDKQST